MLSNRKISKRNKKEELEYTYASRFFTNNIPKYKLPSDGMPSNVAYRLIHDELNLDGNTGLNLASFVTTWMEDEADMLIMENLGKNMVDNDEYPKTAEIQDRVVTMLASLFNAPPKAKSIGTSTIGSSEAIMLGMLAHKWTWKNKRVDGGKPCNTPNIVMGADVHTVWEKFAKYFDVELRMIPMEDNSYTLTASKLEDMVNKENIIDENTIGIGLVLGTTFTGQIDEIEKINNFLLKLKEEKGLDIPIHVDAASGGFVTPFIDPDYKWDFRLEQVRSINVSGHKYGLVYPGVGWLIFKDKTDLPDDLVFHVNYLGGSMPTFNLNFSKASNMVIAQYYNLLRLGKTGYTNIMNNAIYITKYLAENIVATGKFELLVENIVLPVIAIKLVDYLDKKDLNGNQLNVYIISAKLREKGWLVPAYSLPANADNINVLRIVIKENFSVDTADMLLKDINDIFEEFDSSKNKSFNIY
ncbi:MAG: glutamate decarboxylase [Methanobacteriaceae archaeon]